MPRTPDQATAYTSVGLTLVATVVLFGFGGFWLDGKLGTTPLFLVLGVLVGMVGGFFHLFRVVAPGMLPFGNKSPTDASPTNKSPTRDSPTDTRAPERNASDSSADDRSAQP